DSKGVPVTLFTNQFYTNSIPSGCYTLPVGSAFINNGKVQETYHKYNTQGNLIETKTLFPTRDYAIFSGVFDETGQTTFEFDLTGLTIADGILVVSSTAVPYTETLYETHSEPGIGYQNTGVWQGKYFLADYTRCTPEPDCYSGQTKIGPFEHYPGSPDYTGYTLWIEDNTQYVKTSFSQIVNEYPAEVDYKINTSSWETITSSLGSGTTSTIIPASSLVVGTNTLQFEESNSYSTKFGWALYLNQGSTPEAYTTYLTYDSYGNMTSITNALGNTTTFGYDLYHLYVASVTDTLNQAIIPVYDIDTGLLTSITNPKGHTTFFEYDILGRVTKKINPDLTEKEAVYDDLNNCITLYDELDHKKVMYYDGIGQTKRIDTYFSLTEYLTEWYTYTHQGNVKTRTDSDGHIYSYEYDSRGRVTKTFNPDSTVKQTVYNDTTNTVTIIDENQHKKEYSYDWAGNLVEVKEYTDAVTYYLTQCTYDSLGNMTSVTDANGNTTFNEYSLYGITRITYPDLTTEEFSYDAAGNLLEIRDAEGTTTFTYDAIHQLKSIEYPDESITFEYDANGNRIAMTDSLSTTNYTYDNRDRLLYETAIINAQSYTLEYSYDATSKMVSVVYPDSYSVTYEYDALNRVVAVPGYAEFTYEDSHLATMTFSNGAVTTFQYDSNDRPIAMQASKNSENLLIMNYTYDLEGNITQLDYQRRLPDQTWTESQETFVYDWLDRLVEAQGDYHLSYQYDGTGNRLSLNGLGYTYNSMNELVTISDGTVFIYDERGNTITKTDSDTWSYTYNKRNLLEKVTKNQEVLTEYVYDGDGRRVQVTENGETTTYIYSSLNMLYEENTTGIASYIYGPPGRLAKKTHINGESNTFFYHTDHLGSTLSVTDGNGTPISSIEYQPFGESSITGSEEDYQFAGKEKDASGLYYFGARYYDPQLGRFTTKDPLPGRIQSPQTLNRYVYCLNNPLKYLDPQGMQTEPVELPDGTISQPLTDLYSALETALANLSTEQLDEINKLLAGSDADKLQAVIEILKAANIAFDFKKATNTLSVKFGDVKFFIEFANIREHGKIATGTDTGNKFIVLNNNISKAGDLFLTLGHELVHANMIAFHGDVIDTIQQQFGDLGNEAFNELIAYQWEGGIAEKMWADKDKLQKYVTNEYAGGIWCMRDWYQNIWSYIDRGGI
ncbi:MAG: hypothetical protein HXS44_12660, partial [Theionarchaea archaeon]|nr:hypothetical protein [Theionarchaea archaeon]